MTGSKAHINPKMLLWARKTVKLSVDLAASKIGVKQETLQSWEEGEYQPTIKQLYKIAHVYKRPFALFYFPKPPSGFKPLKDFRKFFHDYLLDENEEYILHKELLLFQRKREMSLELYEQLETESPKFMLKGTLNESPDKLAKKIIDYLGINHNEVADIKPGYDALNYWKNKLESKGILVFQTSGVPVNVMRGACIAKDIMPVVIINSNDTQNGRIFSLFHELVHIVLREEGISNFRFRDKDLFDPVEIYCNQTAAEVFVPKVNLLQSAEVRFHKTLDEWSDDELHKLSNKFCVSREVILRRLLTLGKTSSTFYRNYRSTYDYKDDKKTSGGDYYRNIIARNGRLFLNLALQGYYQEKLTASTLSDFINIKVSNLANLEEKLYDKVQY